MVHDRIEKCLLRLRYESTDSWAGSIIAEVQYHNAASVEAAQNNLETLCGLIEIEESFSGLYARSRPNHRLVFNSQ